MPVISAAVLDQVRERAQIVDLFAAGELRKAGADFLARCPWHDDRRPSLSVSPKRNRVYCFVCGKGTDAIGWLQDRQGLSFQEAVLELARRTGVTVAPGDPEAQERFEREWRERRALMTKRAEQRDQWHQVLLKQLVSGGAGADYLRRRGISEQSAALWQLGLEAGRLMVPINDAGGQVVGFCGRTTGHQEPRYRNSTNDLLFQRNGVVFGLDRAAEAIRKEGTALLVEGPLDVIQLHQAGFTNAVACLGTSVSALQLKLLRRCGMRQLQIAFDGDPAGRNATERLIEHCISELSTGALSLSVLELGEGEDADSLIRAKGADAMALRSAGARHWLHWRLERLLAPWPIAKAAGDLESLQHIEARSKALLEQLPDGALRRAAGEQIEQVILGTSPPRPLRFPEPPHLSSRQRAERRALQLLIHAPQYRDLLLCLPIHDPGCRAAMDWAANVAVATAADQLPQALLKVAEQLSDGTGALLLQACKPAPEVIRHLQRHCEAEMQQLMDLLEPKERPETCL